jgi:glycosyltransferase involved in cell wall biosynthesis
MRVNWFSPLPPARTDIGHYTARLLPALVERCEVILWTDQARWDPRLERRAVVKRFDLGRMPWAEINAADVSVFNIGNNAAFHVGIWRASRRHPGIVVMHDVRLQDFFLGAHDREGYVAAMEQCYGMEGRQAATRFLEDRRLAPYMSERYPMTALGADNALGVIIHNDGALARVAGDTGAPVLYAPLPYPAAPAHGAARPARRGRRPYRLVVFGYLGRNRRLSSMLKALADFPDKKAFRVDIYGELYDPAEVRALVRSLGLQHRVTVHGFVAERVLDRALESAELALHLRYPTMDEGSGSQLRIWDHALPSLVTPVGWFAGLPRDIVAFVRPDSETADIHRHLRSFLENPDRFAAMGRRGRRRLEELHSPRAYADAVVGFAARAPEFRARVEADTLSERVAGEVSTWMPPAPSDGMMDGVAGRIKELVS